MNPNAFILKISLTVHSILLTFPQWCDLIRFVSFPTNYYSKLPSLHLLSISTFLSELIYTVLWMASRLRSPKAYFAIDLFYVSENKINVSVE
jgi:hypothetical protein